MKRAKRPRSDASESGDRARARWIPFGLGLVAPFALPFFTYLILGSMVEPWIYGAGWGALLLLGLGAGVVNRSWAFFFGALIAIVLYVGAVLLRDAPWFD